MKQIKELLELMEKHISTVCENFYNETKLSELQTGKEFTETVKKARETNDKRAMLKNMIDEKMARIINMKGIKQPESNGEIWESLGFLWDRYVIENLKVWHFESKIRIIKNAGETEASAYAELVKNSRLSNDSRLELREAVEKKIKGILVGAEKIGTSESKFFFCQGRR